MSLTSRRLKLVKAPKRIHISDSEPCVACILHPLISMQATWFTEPKNLRRILLGEMYQPASCTMRIVRDPLVIECSPFLSWSGSHSDCHGCILRYGLTVLQNILILGNLVGFVYRPAYFKCTNLVGCGRGEKSTALNLESFPVKLDIHFRTSICMIRTQPLRLQQEHALKQAFFTN